MFLCRELLPGPVPFRNRCRVRDGSAEQIVGLYGEDADTTCPAKKKGAQAKCPDSLCSGPDKPSDLHHPYLGFVHNDRPEFFLQRPE